MELIAGQLSIVLLPCSFICMEATSHWSGEYWGMWLSCNVSDIRIVKKSVCVCVGGTQREILFLEMLRVIKP